VARAGIQAGRQTEGQPRRSSEDFSLPDDSGMVDNPETEKREHVKKAIWIAFDLGVNGDYDGMYGWLDNHEARECGDNFAFLRFEYEDDLLDELKASIKDRVLLSPRKGRNNRIYVVYQTEENKIKGAFLFGTRRKPPWIGYGIGEETETSDE